MSDNYELLTLLRVEKNPRALGSKRYRWVVGCGSLRAEGTAGKQEGAYTAAVNKLGELMRNEGSAEVITTQEIRAETITTENIYPTLRVGGLCTCAWDDGERRQVRDPNCYLHGCGGD